jgi:hypothetical protein
VVRVALRVEQAVKVSVAVLVQRATAATVARAAQAPMAQMQLWPDQLAEMERTVEPEALAAKVAKAVLAVRAQKLVLIQPAATAVMAVLVQAEA